MCSTGSGFEEGDMIGLFALAVLVAWVKLTQWFWRFWRIRRKEMIKTKIVFFDSVFTVGMLVWLSVFLWYTGGQRFYYDAKVKRLCAIGGGVKVYETVILPADKFDNWGEMNFYAQGGENALGPEYVYKNTHSYIRKGYPSIEKRHTQIYRRHDMRLIGEKITYSREGGGLPRPFGFSTYRCPEEDTSLFEKLFIMQKGDF
jgi:hypothetical protein